MATQLYQPILADGGAFSALVFLILMFLGWLLNLANAKNQQPGRGPQRQPRRPRPPREVEDVFAELRRRAAREMQRQQGQPPRPERRRPEPEQIEEFVDVQEVPQRPARQQAPRPPRRRPQPMRRPQPVQEPQRRQSARAAAERLTGPDARAQGQVRLGETLQSHLQEYMRGDRIDDSVAEHLQHAVGSLASAQTGKPGQGPAQIIPGELGGGVRSLLKSIPSVRQAILINEIMQKPKALRR